MITDKLKHLIRGSDAPIQKPPDAGGPPLPCKVIVYGDTSACTVCKQRWDTGWDDRLEVCPTKYVWASTQRLQKILAFWWGMIMGGSIMTTVWAIGRMLGGG